MWAPPLVRGARSASPAVAYLVPSSEGWGGVRVVYCLGVCAVPYPRAQARVSTAPSRPCPICLGPRRVGGGAGMRRVVCFAPSARFVREKLYRDKKLSRYFTLWTRQWQV